MDRDDAASLLTAVLAHAPGPLAVLDTELRYVLVNRRWEAHHGLTGDEVRGRSHAEVFPDVPETWRELMRRLVEDGSSRSGTDPLSFRAGRLDWLRWTFSAWHRADGTVGGVLLAYEVLTEQRRVAERVDRLVAMLSHELRTPLTGILGALRLLEGGGDEVAEGSARLLAVASRSADRMLAVVDDLLDLQRIRLDDLDLDPRPLLLSDVIRDALRRAAPLAEGRGVRLACDDDRPSGAIIGDPGRLGSVLDRALENAIRWSPAGGRVQVDLEVDQGWVRVRVDDQGPGVPEAHRETVFEPFVQASTGDARTHEGVGLGLALCRAVIERHGGAIGLDTAPGGGARLWFELPAYPTL